ncbi:MAG: double zinc ribbon domain-containing protein [Porticoccus sp.]|nr:double zinc ribbon domain-containing protein [Porticoccus sp.]
MFKNYPTKVLAALIQKSWKILRNQTLSPRNFSFYLFPGYCILCGVHSNRSLDLCQPCEADLPINQPCCQRCAIPLASNYLCGACVTNTPPFNQCTAPLRYEFPVDKLINRFKYGGQLNQGAILAHVLFDKLSEQYQTTCSLVTPDPSLTTKQHRRPDVIIPVPLHWRRRFIRGFNQSEWLAHFLGKRLKIDVDHQIISRQKHTPPQQGMTRKQRQKNLKGAFHVTHRVDGQHIALVDDVVTTGSTVAELSLLLKKAGAAQVEIWCLARTPLEK